MKSSFVDYVVDDLLADVGGVRARAMFGGHGIYKDALIFAIIVDDELYFKVGDSNRKDFEVRGSEPFVYEAKGGKRVAMSYWKLPADVMEDRDMLLRWVKKSSVVSRAAGSGQ